MKIIPVIDLKDGKVVAARGGDRSAYRTLKTPLASSSDPVDVVRGLLDQTRADIVYVADLDGIEQRSDHAACVRRLLQAFPQVSIWLDAGVRSDADLTPELSESRVIPVIGSETLDGLSALAGLNAALAGAFILSLDFRGGTFVGHGDVLERSDQWPERVIVMSLASVGAAAGPDMGLVEKVAGAAGQRSVFAAGGVRHQGDLQALARLGVSGTLVSTALHAGTLKFNDR
jgi:phosphoribosylformimino-5-aminoimidazole carboxamide ribotide isomerase